MLVLPPFVHKTKLVDTLEYSNSEELNVMFGWEKVYKWNIWQAQIHTIYVDSILITEENENSILRLTTVLLLTLTSDISSLEQEGSELLHDVLYRFFSDSTWLPATDNQRQDNLFFYNMGNFLPPVVPYVRVTHIGSLIFLFK